MRNVKQEDAQMDATTQNAQTICNAQPLSFDDLMRKHYRTVYAIAYRLSGHRTDAEDLTQEAFVRAYRFFHRYNNTMPFENWMYRITRNAFVDMIRRRPSKMPISLDQPLNANNDDQRHFELPDLTHEPQTVMMAIEVDHNLQKALNTLSPDFRETVILADMQGMSYEEIAELLGCSQGTVRSRLHRARKAMKDWLVANAGPDFLKEFQP